MTSLSVGHQKSSRFNPVSRSGFVAIDIGSFAIKVLQLDLGSKRHKLRFCRIVPHEIPLDAEDPAACVEQIGKTLGRAWSVRNRWLPYPAACTVSMSLLDFRSLTLPMSPEDLTSEALDDAYATDSDTDPFSTEIRGWHALKGGGTQDSCSVSVIGLNKDFAADIAATMWKCGLDCQILDGPPFALARSVQNIGPGPTAVFDWGFRSASLTIADQGRPQFTRSMRQCGLTNLSESLMKSLNVDAEQSRQLLHTYGLGEHKSGGETSDLQVALSELTTPYLSKLMDEIQRSWNYLKQQPDQAPKRIILTGGGALLPHAVECISRMVPLPVETWRSEFAGPVNTLREILSPAYASTLALAQMER